MILIFRGGKYSTFLEVPKYLDIFFAFVRKLFKSVG